MEHPKYLEYLANCIHQDWACVFDSGALHLLCPPFCDRTWFNIEGFDCAYFYKAEILP